MTSEQMCGDQLRTILNTDVVMVCAIVRIVAPGKVRIVWQSAPAGRLSRSADAAPLPNTVQPNRWLQYVHQQAFVRLVGSDGCVALDLHPYYISQSLAGQPVALLVDAHERCSTVWRSTTLFTRLPMKGLFEEEEMPFEH
jgi:hypothetical protein